MHFFNALLDSSFVLVIFHHLYLGFLWEWFEYISAINQLKMN